MTGVDQALVGVRNRAAALADAIVRMSRARDHYLRSLQAAQLLGADQVQMSAQVELATRGRPDRAAALNAFAANLDAQEGGGTVAGAPVPLDALSRTPAP